MKGRHAVLLYKWMLWMNDRMDATDAEDDGNIGPWVGR